MRYLIACCDGTWNTAAQPSVTNVFRLYRALAQKDANGREQVRHYDGGVGTGGDLFSWLRGGIAGAGLSAKVMEAYRWLTTTFEPGDYIALFGFSRGAYTARSVAGMIAACGLLDTGDLSDRMIRQAVEQVYTQRYRRGDRADLSWRNGLTFSFDPADAHNIPVRFLGVWDTVGALGIPDNLGLLNLWDDPKRYSFHNVELNPHIKFARQALAMDERRGPFAPTLWDVSSGPSDQDVQQVWFPGSHMDVGGGHPETGLSDGALLWMIQAAQQADLLFDRTMLDEKQVRPDPGDKLHDDDRDSLRLLAPLYDPLIGPVVQPFFQSRPRAVPALDESAPTSAVHPSAYARQGLDLLTSMPYRPTEVVHAGEHQVDVLAHEPWNDTGLYLQPGKYSFAAEGEWHDASICSGPDGTTGMARFNPLTERLRLLGTALGPIETFARRVTGNQAYNLLLSRREEDLPWMCLVGVIANENAPKANQRIVIGTGTTDVTVTKGGYLYAFANDAWGFYGNNTGSLRLTVTRTG